MAVTMEGVRCGQSKTPYIRAAEGALRAAGMWDDQDWMLVGLSGLGFHLVVEPGTCPSSPTAYDWTTVHTEAMGRIGVRSRCFEGTDPDTFEATRASAVRAVKAALDRGAPAVFRTFEYAEFGILHGYDDTDGVLFASDATGSADPVLYGNLGRPHGYPALFVQVLEEREPFDLTRSAADSFRYAVDCWRAGAWEQSYGSGYKVGAEGYRALIAAVEADGADPLGLRYILAILADAREAVARYMNRLLEEDVLPSLAAPTELYCRAAGKLTRASELLPASPPFERPLEREVVPEAAELLREAAGLEEEAIGRLAERRG